MVSRGSHLVMQHDDESIKNIAYAFGVGPIQLSIRLAGFRNHLLATLNVFGLFFRDCGGRFVQARLCRRHFSVPRPDSRCRGPRGRPSWPHRRGTWSKSLSVVRSVTCAKAIARCQDGASISPCPGPKVWDEGRGGCPWSCRRTQVGQKSAATIAPKRTD
jgi:hypothetical protein